MKNISRQIILHVVLPLFLGCLIYLLFRENTYIHRLVFGIDHNAIFPPKNLFTRIIALNLPDFFWSYSFAASLFLWEKWQGRSIKFFPSLILLILLAAEFMQLLMPGIFRFDWIDGIAALIAFILSYLKFRPHAKT